MLLELAPLLLSGFSVFGTGAHRAAPVEKPAVGAHQFFIEDCHVCLGGVDVLVAEEAGDDVDR